LRATTDDALIVLNATDPTNIFGGALRDAPRFARLASTHVVLWRGQPVVIAEDNGERILAQNIGGDALKRALQTYIERSHAPRHIVVKQWNGEDILGSASEPLLQSLGFYRTPKGMER
jgi:hypothetical protein